jgi:hypothetical protein
MARAPAPAPSSKSNDQRGLFAGAQRAGARHKQLDRVVASKSAHTIEQEGYAKWLTATWSISKNTRKEKPSQADYTGSIVIEGRKFWLNGWVKDGEKGKFLSQSAKPAEEPKTKPAARDWQRPDRDEIPF